MNPALLPLLVLGVLLGVAARRARHGRETALVLVFLTAVACVLFSPLLLERELVPSGTALLDKLPPWKGSLTSAIGASDARVNPEQNDLPYQVEPRQLFVREELRAGRLPFWNPYAFGGFPVWSSAQSAPLSPLTWLFAVLPLELGCFVLPLARLLFAGSGAYALARELGLGRPAALLGGTIFAFSGRQVGFALYPLATATACIPWLLLGVERIGRTRWAIVLVALASAAQWTSGHPETAAFTVAASGLWLLLRQAFAPAPLRSTMALASRLATGLATGALLAGAAIVPFVLQLPETARFRDWKPGAALSLAEQAAVLVRFLLPEAFGDPTVGTHFGRWPHVPTLVYCGAFALPLAGIAFAAGRTDRRVRHLFFFGGVALAVALATPGVHQLFLLVPGIRHGIAHYFLPFAILALSLLAGLGAERLGAASPRQLAAIGFVLAGLLGAAAFALYGDWSTRDLLAANLVRSAIVLGAIALLALNRRRLAEPRGAAALTGLLALELALSLRHEIPRSPVRALFPATPALEAIRGDGPGRISGDRWTLPANTATLYRLRDLRGADAAAPARPSIEVDEQTLDRWSVRYWLSPTGSDAVPRERASAWPLVRFENYAAAATSTLVASAPGRWTIDWSSSKEDVLSIADAFDRGWTATSVDRTLTIDGSDPLRLRIPVGPGSGRLELRYRPRGLSAGLVASVCGLVALAALGLGARREARRACLDRDAAGTIPAALTADRSPR